VLLFLKETIGTNRINSAGTVSVYNRRFNAQTMTHFLQLCKVVGNETMILKTKSEVLLPVIFSSTISIRSSNYCNAPFIAVIEPYRIDCSQVICIQHHLYIIHNNYLLCCCTRFPSERLMTRVLETLLSDWVSQSGANAVLTRLTVSL
jgi:hypothetical protein